MNRYEEYRRAWLAEERAPFAGWDFSYLEGRWEEEPLPWDYGGVVQSLLRPFHRLLDMGTGGGEWLLRLGHPHRLIWATEGWESNLELCRRRLSPLGITVRRWNEGVPLPFEDNSFDVVINRHESYDPAEVYRVLAPGGVFVTQQVGGTNGAELSGRLVKDFTPLYPHEIPRIRGPQMEAAGFEILRLEEHFPLLKFFDVGALVYYARRIPWEFPGFSVEGCFNALLGCQRELEEKGVIISRQHRYLLVGRRPQ